jgi:hypothetical protein
MNAVAWTIKRINMIEKSEEPGKGKRKTGIGRREKQT